MTFPVISKTSRGFTLLESLVALAVVAIAMAALWKGLLQGQAVSRELPDRIVARWVAQNHMITRQAMGEWPETRSYRGKESMAGKDWYWEEVIASTTVADMRRITINVGRTDDEVVFTLEGYLQRSGPPLPYEQIFGR
jgi:general secretion pathway protein I